MSDKDLTLSMSDQPMFMNKMRWAFSLCVVAYGMLFNGFVYGYMSPALPQLVNNTTSSDIKSQLTISQDEASWLSSLTSLGIPVGGLLCGMMVENIGKKWTALLGQTLSFVVGHILLTVAPSVEYLYAGRFICGICQGFCNCLTYLYILWICHGKSARTKSMAGATLCLIGNAGTLLTYGLGVVLDWRQLAGALACLAMPYILGLIFVVPNENDMLHTTDIVLDGSSGGTMTKNLVVTLSSQGGCINNNVLDEKATTELSSQESIYMELERHDDSCQSEWFRILAIKIKEGLCCIALWNGLAMMLFYQFGGYNVVTFYASEIIRGDMEDGHEKALIAAVSVAFSGLVGVMIGLLVVRLEVGRKTILIASGLGTSAAFVALSLAFHVEKLGVVTDLATTLLYIKTVALVVHVLFFNLGYGALVFHIIAEILPLQNRSKYMAVVTTFGGAFGFANTKSFEDLRSAFGPIVTFATYAAINMCGTTYYALFVPR